MIEEQDEHNGHRDFGGDEIHLLVLDDSPVGQNPLSQIRQGHGDPRAQTHQTNVIPHMARTAYRMTQIHPKFLVHQTSSPSVRSVGKSTPEEQSTTVTSVDTLRGCNLVD